MNKMPVFVSIAAASIVFATCAQAQYVQDDRLFYRIGGAVSVSAPVAQGPVSFARSSTDGFSCGAFNPKLDVKSMLSGLVGNNTSIAGILDLGSIPTGITAGLPGGVLCRAQPVLCQLTQHYSVRSEDAFRHSIDACGLLVDNQPSTAWQRHAKTQEWQRQQRSGATATEAHRQVEETNDPCITWVGGREAGCPGKPPVRPVRDTVIAGWCVVNGQAADCTSAATNASRSNEIWTTPKAAADWVAEVVGDIGIESNSTPTTSPPIGLQPKIEEEKGRLLETIQEVYDTAPQLRINQRQQDVLFAPAGNIQPNVVYALYDIDDNGIYADRIATEAATARIIDQALLAHRLLLTGQSEPNIAATDPAKEQIATALERLEKEIDRLAWEFQIRRSIVADTSLELLEAHRISQTPNTGVSGSTAPARRPAL